MVAYAALVTLSKDIRQLLPYEQHYSFLCHKQKMKSLLDKDNSFRVFLEDVSGKSLDGVDELESRIRDVAYQLEDIVEPILVDSLAKEYQNEVNSQLSIQGAEDRDVPRKFKKTVKDGSDEAHHSMREEDLSEMKKTLDGKGSLSILTPGHVNQTTGHESTVPAASAKFETETSLENILGWCLDDQDLEDKAKYSHLPLIERDAAAFGNCIEEADLLLKEATEMKKNLDNKLVISGTYDITTTSLSRGPSDSNNTVVGLKDGLHQILEQIRSHHRALEVIPITVMGGIGKTTLTMLSMIITESKITSILCCGQLSRNNIMSKRFFECSVQRILDLMQL